MTTKAKQTRVKRKPSVGVIAAALHETGSGLGVARKLKVSKNQAYAWANDPEVRRAAEELDAEVAASYRVRVRSLAGTALDTLEEVMLDTAQPGAARIAAAKTVLDRVLPARGELEVRGHIEVHAIARLTVEQLAEEEARLQRDLEAIEGEAEVVPDA